MEKFLRKSRSFARFLVCIVCSLPAWAQADVLQIGNLQSYALSSSFSYLEDASAQLSVQDVVQAEAQARFKPVAPRRQGSNFGSTSSALWLRAQLQTGTNTPQNWLLEIANPPLDRFDIYVSTPQGGYTQLKGGDSLSFSQRTIAHYNHTSAIHLAPNQTSTLYLRLSSQGAVAAPVTLWQPDALWQSDQKAYALFSLYFGLLVGLVVYNLLLFCSVHEKTHLIYGAFTVCLGLSQLANSGLGAQFFWPQSVWWNNNAVHIMDAASGIFAVMFTRSFLLTRTATPRLDACLRVMLALWVGAFFLALAAPYRVVDLFIALLSLASAVTVLLAWIFCWRQGHPGALYFGLAWCAFSAGVFIQVLHNNGLLPSNQFSFNAVLLGSALEMLLLSRALADRINQAHRDKELALARFSTEQARVQVLQQSQERYIAVIEHVGEGMLVVQHERIVFANTRATQILEMSKQDIFADGFLNRVHSDDRARLVRQLRLRISAAGASEPSEVRFAPPGKPEKWLEFGDSAVPWDGGQGLLIFFLDVTERHAAEQEIRTTLQRQQELNDLRSRFVAMTSHEFRTPLATILSAQDLLKNFESRMGASQKAELLDMIEAGVHRMTGMLERVLLLGQADARMLEFKPRMLDLPALCEDIVADVKAQSGHSHHTVVTEFAPDVGMGWYDQALMHHIFANLLSNALKYSPTGGEVRLRVHLNKTHTVFEVSDQGIGIPAGELGDLFASFQRASNVGEIRGTGLGLAIVKQALDLHRGTVQVQSQVGVGTCFTVLMPMQG